MHLPRAKREKLIASCSNGKQWRQDYCPCKILSRILIEPIMKRKDFDMNKENLVGPIAEFC